MSDQLAQIAKRQQPQGSFLARNTGQKSSMPEELLTKDVLAARLKKSERTIERWVKNQIICSIKIRNSVFYDWNGVLASLARHGMRATHSPQQGPKHLQPNQTNEKR